MIPRTSRYNQDGQNCMHRLVTIGRDEEALAVYQTFKPRADAASDAKAGRVLIRTMVI